MSSKRAKLVLGTAQVGMPYGAANTVGMPTAEQAEILIRSAVNSGIDTFDTARAYGEAEQRLGRTLVVHGPTLVTKLDPLVALPAGAAPADVEAAVAGSLAASRAALRRQRLDVMLLHRAAHRIAWDGIVWRRLRRERDAGGIGRIGVSAQDPGEVLDALSDPDLLHLQLPFNLLDHRWDRPEIQAALRARPDVTIHVRSIFLQGLLAGAAVEHWPTVPGTDAVAVRTALLELQHRFGRSSLADLCVAFVRAQDWIDGIVIGMERVEQLQQNLALFERPPLTPGEASAVRATRPVLPEVFLDPAQWLMVRT